MKLEIIYLSEKNRFLYRIYLPFQSSSVKLTSAKKCGCGFRLMPTTSLFKNHCFFKEGLENLTINSLENLIEKMYLQSN